MDSMYCSSLFACNQIVWNCYSSVCCFSVSCHAGFHFFFNILQSIICCQHSFFLGWLCFTALVAHFIYTVNTLYTLPEPSLVASWGLSNRSQGLLDTGNTTPCLCQQCHLVIPPNRHVFVHNSLKSRPNYAHLPSLDSSRLALHDRALARKKRLEFGLGSLVFAVGWR